MNDTRAKRIGELLELAEAEGIRLPWPAAMIAGIEERGGYVDLITGHIGSAEERIELTVIGEAAAIVSAILP